MSHASIGRKVLQFLPSASNAVEQLENVRDKNYTPSAYLFLLYQPVVRVCVHQYRGDLFLSISAGCMCVWVNISIGV